MDFSDAVAAMRDGKRVRHESWQNRDFSIGLIKVAGRFELRCFDHISGDQFPPEYPEDYCLGEMVSLSDEWTVVQ